MAQQHDAMHQGDPPDAHGHQRTTPLKGLVSLVLAIVVVAAYIALSGVLGITDMWVGFLFALYWAALQRSDFKKLAACFIGAAVGLGYASLFRALPPLVGSATVAICIGLVIVMVYLQIMGWMTLIINSATMLFMLVSTIPSIMMGTQLPNLLAALTFGAGYFALVIWTAKQVRERRAADPRPDAARSVLSK